MACVIETEKPKTERTRHSRKYVEGNLGAHSFYFRGPEGKLNLKATNLMLFLMLADGVDEDTWLFHLRRGEYSEWFRTKVKDPELADIAAGVESDDGSRRGEPRRAFAPRSRSATRCRRTKRAA